VGDFSSQLEREQLSIQFNSLHSWQSVIMLIVPKFRPIDYLLSIFLLLPRTQMCLYVTILL